MEVYFENIGNFYMLLLHLIKNDILEFPEGIKDAIKEDTCHVLGLLKIMKNEYNKDYFKDKKEVIEILTKKMPNKLPFNYDMFLTEIFKIYGKDKEMIFSYRDYFPEMDEFKNVNTILIINNLQTNNYIVFRNF